MKTTSGRIGLFLLLLLPISVSARPKSLETQALETMKTATQYMMDVVGYRGGFVWNYLPDLSRQWGEMEAKRTMVWTQDPGTPQMGQLLLDAYHATGDEYYYEAAKQVAQALIWGQHESGGWNYTFDFAGEASLKDWYATVGRSGWRLEEFQHYYGNATFDDSCTSQCAKFLLRIYAEKYDPSLRPALDKAIRFVLDSQYPNGGWPQRWPLMYDHPFQGRADYSSFITLNDDVIPECIDFLVQCYQTLGLPGLKEPIYRAMYLCILLQQGAPYAGWSDQYYPDSLKPAHARSYEPRAISTSCTAAMVRQLMAYYRLTGGGPLGPPFLRPGRHPRAALHRSRDGRPAVRPPRGKQLVQRTLLHGPGHLRHHRPLQFRGADQRQGAPPPVRRTEGAAAGGGRQGLPAAGEGPGPAAEVFRHGPRPAGGREGHHRRPDAGRILAEPAGQHLQSL